jgi:hypothetical protein
MPAAATLDQRGHGYITAFQGTPDDDGIIRGVSIIQEGPALGHGTVVDRTTLSQVKKLAQAKGKLKAKTDHFGSVLAAFGWFQNFRIRSDKLLGDLHLLEKFEGREQLLELISEMPEHFGVSIFFREDAPEMNAEKGALVRVSDLFSADLVDMPAANRDGLFSEKIDSESVCMAKDPPATPPAHEDAIQALQTRIESLSLTVAELKTAFEAKAELPSVQEPPPDPKKLAAEIVAEMKLMHAAPQTQKPTVDQQSQVVETKAFAAAKKEFIGEATGFVRMRKSREWDQKYPDELAYKAGALTAAANG